MSAGQVPPILTWLYVPGDRQERVAKALQSAADAVIIDLEDAVAPPNKAAARSATADLLAVDHDKPVIVRVNALGSEWAADDLADLANCAGLSAVRIPKVEAGSDVDDVVNLLADQLPSGGIQCLIESALGLEAAFEIARHPAVASIGLGEADLRADIGAQTESGLAWARGRVVNAARAAGLPSPAQSVFPYLHDPDGLAQSCALGRELGFFGRAAIHPEQLSVIVQAYLPTIFEVEAATGVLDAADGSAGRGSIALDDGRFVDAAVVAGARRVIAVAERYGIAASS